MRATTEIGTNRSGIAVAPEAANKMMENIKLTKPPRGDETTIAGVRIEYARDADPVGSLPEPKQSGIKAVFMDKLGERLAFERAGTRLYDALMAKCEAEGSGDVPAKELQHIRDEEAMHFALIGAAIQSLGGDPTAQTPAADVTGVEGSGLMQVLTDPKTTVAQALHSMLIAELADNAAWEELIELAGEAGGEDLVPRFEEAQNNELEHLEKVQAWYKAATMSAGG
ncbi:MAG TPA: ferritin-like domain-containing protein [Burkholderiales bacterium]|nr:ferritin-like domain-containing protein [Burkholderiales bacterium]